MWYILNITNGRTSPMYIDTTYYFRTRKQAKRWLRNYLHWRYPDIDMRSNFEILKSNV